MCPGCSLFVVVVSGSCALYSIIYVEYGMKLAACTGDAAQSFFFKS